MQTAAAVMGMAWQCADMHFFQHSGDELGCGRGKPSHATTTKFSAVALACMLQLRAHLVMLRVAVVRHLLCVNADVVGRAGTVLKASTHSDM